MIRKKTHKLEREKHSSSLTNELATAIYLAQNSTAVADISRQLSDSEKRKGKNEHVGKLKP